MIADLQTSVSGLDHTYRDVQASSHSMAEMAEES
ncbi:hypothetical protein ADUPG1_004458, partial [Aduncisulcus paluster]